MHEGRDTHKDGAAHGAAGERDGALDCYRDVSIGSQGRGATGEYLLHPVNGTEPDMVQPVRGTEPILSLVW